MALKKDISLIKAELKRTIEERDILKKAVVSSAGRRNIICSNSDFEEACMAQMGRPVDLTLVFFTTP